MERIEQIEQVLSREIGLMSKSIGSAAIEAAVRERMAQCRLASAAQYLERLEGDAGERRALIEEVVVSETWFFRDADVFRDLGAFAAGPFRRANPEGALRVLCVPCATGEEPYSAAITLLEAGLPAARISVHGVDVSERALARARQAVYGKNAFRSAHAPELDRYFQNVDGGRKVNDQIRSLVTFAQGNVLDPFLISPGSRFDVIFCRNLLIYLDAAARGRALDNLWRWLAPEGRLFGGHAEAIETMDGRFQHATDSGHCTYVQRPAGARKAPAPSPVLPGAELFSWRGPALPPSQPGKPKPAPVSIVSSKPHGAAPAKTSPAASSAGGPTRSESQSQSLLRATELANRGDPGAALACERHIAEFGPSADAYGLLGVLRTAAGEERAAIEAFNRALYLEPAHYPSLIHLALLHERRGDHAVASNFRRRAERAKQKPVFP